MPKILIIEDEKMLAEMYQDKFESSGYKTDLVFSSEEAFDYLKEKKPDLILLDILLPQANGVSFMKKIKELKTAENIPIVVFSNYDDPKAKKEAFLLGAKDYLIKTKYTPSALLEEIKKYISD